MRRPGNAKPQLGSSRTHAELGLGAPGIPPGYKQTEVGIIPEEWEVKSLGPYVQITSGESPSRFRFSNEGIPYFKVDQLNNNSKYLADTPYFISNSRTVSCGSLIFPKRGASILLNKVRILVNDSFMDTNLMTLTARESVHSEYLYYTLIHIELWRIADITSIPQINNKHIVPLLVSLPSLPEQHAIATALSDVDGLIESLEKLIAKKRDLKQAAMQQLLTGKKRLTKKPGSAEPQLGSLRDKAELGLGVPSRWTVKRLGDVLKVRHGKSQHGITAPDGKYPVLASGGEIGRTNVYIYDKPSVLIGRKGTIDSPQYVDAPFWTVDTLFFTEIRGEADAKFVFYKFTMIRWRSYNEASGVPSLNAKTIENIEVTMPPLPEQTAIAAILSDMDAEIQGLETKLSKTRLLKQGMMSELLTGRIRLVAHSNG